MHAMVCDTPGIAITGKLGLEDVNSTQLTKYLKDKDANLCHLTLRKACAAGHRLVLRACHTDVIIAIDGVNDYVHEALGELLAESNESHVLEHPILAHPTIALQGRVTCSNHWGLTTGRPSWLLTLTVAPLRGEEEVHRILLSGHIVNVKNSLGTGKRGKAVEWHQGNVQSLVETAHRYALALREGGVGLSTLSMQATEEWCKACVDKGMPVDNMFVNGFVVS